MDLSKPNSNNQPRYGNGNNGYNNNNGYGNSGYNNGGYNNGGYNNNQGGYNNNGGYNNGGYNNGGYNNGGYNNNQGGYNNNHGDYHQGYANNGYGNIPFNQDAYYARNNAFDADAKGKSRGVAAILAIIVGALGVHYFYMGKSTPGIVFLLVSILSFGFLAWVVALVALVQGILMLCMSNAEFDNKYIYTPSSFPLF